MAPFRCPMFPKADGAAPDYCPGLKKAAPAPDPSFDPVYCDRNFPAEFEVKNNFACKDPNDNVLRDMSEADCQSQCRCSEKCAGYTYNSYRRDCYLKTSCSLGEWHPEDRTGIKLAAAIPYTVLPSTKCQDAIMRTIRFTSNSAMSQCRTSCSQDNKCGAFTFNARNWQCQLYNTCYSTAWDRDSNTGETHKHKNIYICIDRNTLSRFDIHAPVASLC